MIQQINLYQSGDVKENQVFRNPYLLAVLLTSLLLGIISFLSISNLHAKEDQLKVLQAQQQEVQSQIQKLQSQYPNQKIDTTLSQELQQSETHYQNLSQILELLADTKSDRSRGYSGYFSTLADQADNNVWLSQIHIDSENDTISLKGATFKPEHIPLLLQRLQNTANFKGRHFAKLGIQQSVDNSEQVDFSVSSSLLAEKEGNNVSKP